MKTTKWGRMADHLHERHGLYAIGETLTELWRFHGKQHGKDQERAAGNIIGPARGPHVHGKHKARA